MCRPTLAYMYEYLHFKVLFLRKPLAKVSELATNMPNSVTTMTIKKAKEPSQHTQKCQKESRCRPIYRALVPKTTTPSMRKKAYLLCCWRLLAWWQGFELSPSKLPTSAADVDKKTTEKHTGFCSCGERFYFDNCSRCRKLQTARRLYYSRVEGFYDHRFHVQCMAERVCSLTAIPTLIPPPLPHPVKYLCQVQANKDSE